MNKKEKDRLLVLMGEKPSEQTTQEEKDSDDSDTSDEEAATLKATPAEKDSDDSESEDEQVGQSGYDTLQAPGGLDIPRVSDIPIVAKLAKVSEKERLATMTGEEQIAFKKHTKREMVNKVIEKDEEHLETHFVENPYIKLRERASQRSRDSKNVIGESQLTGGDDAEQMRDDDIYIMQDTGKFVIQDLEGKNRN